jgi:RimJ/RimL family protein N-acetyltransferase
MTHPITHPWETPPTGAAAATASAVASGIPVIETERLRLRAPRVADFDTYAAIFTSDRARHIGGPYSREEAWGDFTQATALWTLRGIGMWSIEARADGTLLGFAYLWQEYGDPEPEMGWMLTAAAEGQGYATEAARAMLPLALRLFGPGGVVSYIDATNAPSLRVAGKLGARRDPAAEHGLGDPDLTVWRHGERAVS